MSRGVYFAASGGMAYQRHLDMVANNMANMDTAGFKADRPVYSVLAPDFAALGRDVPEAGSPEALLANAYTGITDATLDLSQGIVSQTGKPTDVALRSEGFFCVEGENGEEQYTRAGNFRVNADNVLVTQDGRPVLGEQGPIVLPSPQITISSDGQITSQGQSVDTLKIVNFDPGQRFSKVGFTRLSAGGAVPRPLENPDVLQGSIEHSNVDPVRCMVEMIQVNRSFETFTKAATALDDSERKATTRLKI